MKSLNKIYILPVLLFFLGACDTNSMSNCDARELPVPSEGEFVLQVASKSTCELVTGEALFDDGPNITNRQGEHVVMIKMQSTSGSETPLTIWFTSEQKMSIDVGNHQIANLPSAPVGQFETRFITNDSTFSFMGHNVFGRGRKAFSTSGTLKIILSEEGSLSGSFEVTGDLEGSGQKVRFEGLFSATNTMIGYPIIL